MKIQTKLFLPLFLLFVLFAAILHFYWVPLLATQDKQNFTEQQYQILQAIEPQLAQAILADDLTTLKNALEQHLVLREKIWGQLIIADANGNSLYSTSKQNISSNKHIIHIEWPIRWGVRQIALIKLVVDMSQRIQQQSQQIRQVEYIMLLVMVLLVVAGALWLHYKVHTPLRKLVQATRSLSAGDLETALPSISSDEWGDCVLALAMIRTHMINAQNSLQEALVSVRASDMRHRTVLDNVADGIITTNEHGYIESFNSAAEKIFGYTLEEVLNKNVKMLMTSFHQTKHDDYIERYNSTRQHRVLGSLREFEGQHKTGNVFPMELAANEMHMGGQRYFCGIVRDISERKEMNRLKEEFISTMSHELRTPLTSIRASLGLLDGGIAGTLSDSMKNLVDISLRNTERLLLLINDILDMEKIGSNSMHFSLKKQPILSLLEQSLALNRDCAQENQVSYHLLNELEADVIVEVDTDRFMQVMYNLLSNAAKFSYTNSQVEIIVSDNESCVRVAVKNQGEGIPKKFHSRIFEKFSQADGSRTRQKGGTGLGLSIVKPLIEKMGGTVAFKSTMSAGTTFYFDLPKYEQADKAVEERQVG